MRSEHQKRAGDGGVLHEHDHLDLIGELGVEQEGRQEGEAGQYKRDNSSFPARDNGERAAHLSEDDQRQQHARNAGRSMMGPVTELSIVLSVLIQK